MNEQISRRRTLGLAGFLFLASIVGYSAFDRKTDAKPHPDYTLAVGPPHTTLTQPVRRGGVVSHGDTSGLENERLTPQQIDAENIAILLCAYSDTAVSEFSPPLIEIRRITQGNDHHTGLSQATQVIAGVKEVKINYSNWQRMSGTRGSYITPEGIKFPQLTQDCVSAHPNGIRNDTNTVSMIFPDLDGLSYGGVAEIRTPGTRKSLGALWMEGNHTLSVAALFHELLHSKGSPHSKGTNSPQNPFDIMALAMDPNAMWWDPVAHSYQPQYPNAYNRWKTGILTDSQICSIAHEEINRVPQRRKLVSPQKPPESGQCAGIQITGGKSYFLEARSQLPPYDGKLQQFQL